MDPMMLEFVEENVVFLDPNWDLQNSHCQAPTRRKKTKAQKQTKAKKKKTKVCLFGACHETVGVVLVRHLIHLVNSPGPKTPLLHRRFVALLMRTHRQW